MCSNGNGLSSFAPRVQRAAGQEHPLGYFPTHLQHLRKERRQINRHLRTYRREPEIKACDRDGFPFVGDHAIPQQGANNLDAVAHPLDWLAVGEAVLRPHLDAMARSQAQDKTLVGEMVHRGRRHGNRWGAADKDAANAGPQ